MQPSPREHQAMRIHQQQEAFARGSQVAMKAISTPEISIASILELFRTRKGAGGGMRFAHRA